MAKPEVRVFNGVNAALLRSFLAFNQNFLGGVRVAACDLNQEGMTDIIAGRGPGAQPEVRAFDGVSGAPFPTPPGSFLAFGASFKGGLYFGLFLDRPAAGRRTGGDQQHPHERGATGVTINSNLTVTFSEPVNVAGNWFKVNCPTSGVRNAADTTVSGGPTTFTIDPPDNMAADSSFGFTTDAALTVSSTVPSNGATGVAVNTNITVNFSESVAITASTFGLECPAGHRRPSRSVRYRRAIPGATRWTPKTISRGNLHGKGHSLTSDGYRHQRSAGRDGDGLHRDV
ncbi:MAG: Ig-like domain-containing protein [Methylococcales bacterium]